MRVAVFSDIHGNIEALTSILKDIKSKHADIIISLGDIIGLGPSSNECLSLINKEDILQIAGNHELYYTKGIDKYVVKNKSFIEHNAWIHSIINDKVDDSLLKYEFNFNNKKILFLHFFQNNNKYPFESIHIFDNDEYKTIFNKYNNYDYVIYGHTHEERIEKYNSTIFYSLQSSGCTTDDKTCYYIIDINDKVDIKKINIKYNRKKFINTLNNINYPNKKEICSKYFGL